MYMVQMIYASRPENVSEQDIQDILELSRRQNAERGLTGILCCGKDFFLQWIEGPRDMLNLLYEELILDKRHRDLVILDYCYAYARTFSDWSMAELRQEMISSELLSRYIISTSFDPFQMSGDAARMFLAEAAKEQGLTIGRTTPLHR